MADEGPVLVPVEEAVVVVIVVVVAVEAEVVVPEVEVEGGYPKTWCLIKNCSNISLAVGRKSVLDR